jgi:hypothetical protein
VVLGDASQVLRLIGSWVVGGPENIGTSTFGRYTSADATVLVLAGVSVAPDEVSSFVTPIAYWNFNETSGNHVADSAGTPQDGIFFAHRADLDDPGPPKLKAPFGAATSADFHRNKREYVAIAHDPLFAVENGTVQFWFNPDRVADEQTMLSKDHSGFLDGGHLNIGLDGGHLEVRLQSAHDSFYIQTQKLIQDDSWYHLAFTFGGDGMKLYLDGNLVGENSFTGGLTGNQEPIVIGSSIRSNREDPGNLSDLYITRPFDGRIDEVAFFNGALNTDQIRQLVIAGASGV